MNSADNELLTRTGPGTIAGEYMRHHWQPILESQVLERSSALTVKALSIELTVYRDEYGQVHGLAARCAHRNTQLSSGHVEGRNLRCFYHGWAFDPAGRCIEQPAEPKPFCGKVSVPSFPIQEHLGLIFAYLGPGSAPDFPRWPEFEQDSIASVVELPCNYFQSAENIVDDAHVACVHRSFSELGGSVRGTSPPIVSAEETEYGLCAHFQSCNRVERNHWVMPNICFLGYDLNYAVGADLPDRIFRAKSIFWYVPIDDESHLHVAVTAPGSPAILAAMARQAKPERSVAEQIHAVLEGKSRVHRESPTTVENKSPDLVRIQDGVAVVGQGAIAPRSHENLGASDAGVVLLRKIWLRQARLLEHGKLPTEYKRPGKIDDLMDSAFEAAP